MADTGEALTGLEQKRLQLEKQITDLQSSIYHWRLWNAEYDGLKEELSSLPEDSTREDILQIGINFGGSQVTEKEVRVLLGDGSPGPTISRSPQQIIRAIDRRIDYVLDNIKALEKRAAALDDKLKAFLVAGQPDTGLNEEGLPITDIVEELDEDGNVISGSTTMPGKETNQLLDVLKKAGLDVPGGKAKSEPTTSGSKTAGATPATPASTSTDAERSSARDVTTSKPTETLGLNTKPQIQQETGRQQVKTPIRENGVPLKSNIPIVDSVKTSTESATSTTDTVEKGVSTMVEVEDDSPEDAALRREMIQYGLEEVGAIVAELELDEDGSEFSIDDEDYDLDDEDSDCEDEYGRSTKRVLDDDYIKQMRELEKKLNAKSLQNIGPDTSSLPSDVRTQVEQGPSAIKKGPAKKKKVAFAEELDIAPEPSPKPAPSVPKAKEYLPPPIQEAVVERSGSIDRAKVQDSGSTRKASRFKRARKTEEPISSGVTTQSTQIPSNIGSSLNSRAPVIPPPLFPATPSTPKPFSQPIPDLDRLSISSDNKTNTKVNNKPIADVLVERTVHNDSAIPPDPDELDESIHRREVAAEFYKLRNLKVQQSGGFLQEDEVEPLVLVDADEQSQNGQDKPKKVSRFKAARAK
ncbi:uncharacterized protein GIQ15_03196 [Arthroderma uncinatum]|uniref:uncharacterized protein n=1 Tax=Arthroderma uncinatum TaxID=74035 RepID=UPI00144A9F5F|nr:uncharacterized protein GIQ15_03196 [Arthroderma uncinatum]KAF3483872.1 hypothetical protein GIQ15_03196 [Arthroderma uncinatum]